MKRAQMKNHLMPAQLKSLLFRSIVFALVIAIAFGTVSVVSVRLAAPEQSYSVSTTLNVVGVSAASDSTSTKNTLGANVANDLADYIATYEFKSDVLDGLGWNDWDQADKYSIGLAGHTAGTRVISLSVRGPDADNATAMLNQGIKTLEKTGQAHLNLESLDVVSPLALDSSANDENVPKTNRQIALDGVKNALLGFVVGLFVCAAWYVLFSPVVRTITRAEDASRLPAIGHVSTRDSRS